MKLYLVLFLLLFASVCGLGQTNSFVTELYLANNFTPKSGITPGSNNTLFLSCDQILARYNVTISGITTTGNRLPSQNQIVSSSIIPTYLLSASQDFSGPNSSFQNSLRIGTPTGRYDSFGINYSGTNSTSWKTLVVTSFDPDYDGDGKSTWSISFTIGGVPVSSYPAFVDVTGLANDATGTFTVLYTPALDLSLPQRCKITYYIVDISNGQGSSATLIIGKI